jgi:hypothetical protein
MSNMRESRRSDAGEMLQHTATLNALIKRADLPRVSRGGRIEDRHAP